MQGTSWCPYYYDFTAGMEELKLLVEMELKDF